MSMSAPNLETGARNIPAGQGDTGVVCPTDPNLVLSWVGADPARAEQALGVPQVRAEPLLVATLEAVAHAQTGRWTEAREAIAGRRTFDETRELVEEAIEQKLGLPEDPDQDVNIRDLSDIAAVYCIGWGDEYFQVSYTIDDQGVVTIAGDPAPVDAETVYTPATESKRTTEAADRIEGRVVEAKGADGTGGRIFGVRIIAFGDSRNSRRYPAAVMTAAAPLYEGAKAYDHHRTESELQTSTIAGLIGSYRDVHAETDGLYGDLHLLPSAAHTAEALDQSLANQAAGLAPLIGISHDVYAKYQPVENGGRRFQEATAILAVNSADVVADPAAGGQATRMVAGNSDDLNTRKDQGMNWKQLIELLKSADAAKRDELLTEHAAVLEASGFTAEDVPTLLGEEAKEPAAVGAPEAATESHARDGYLGRSVIRAALEDAKLDERLTESITARLPEKFTEKDLRREVESAREYGTLYEKGSLTPKFPDVKVTEDELDKKRKRVDATFDGNFAEGYHSLKQMWADVTGYRGEFLSEDINKRILRESIGTQTYDSADRSLESVSASTWNLILGDSITRRMVAEYQQPNLQTWRDIVSSIVPLNDFRTQRLDALGGYGTLPTVNQGAPYQPLTTPGNEESTYAATKRGGTEDITIETIANDDLGAVRRVPIKLGLAAAQTVYRFVWDMLDTNITCTFDSTALAASGHANTATSALSGANMSVVRRKMRAQAARGDTTDILSLTPKFLVVANTLEELGWQLVTSAVAMPSGAPVGAATNIPNIHAQGTQLRIVDYWTSTTEWWLIADPAMTPTIEIGFYQGRQDPELFVQNDPTVGSVFNADKVTYKVRHIYGGTVLDYRGFQRGNA